MNKLLDFYKRVLTSTGFSYDDNGYIHGDKVPSKKFIIDDGKYFVLPTKENIANLVEPDNEGNLVPTKILFNPLSEDLLRGDSFSLKKLKLAVELRLGFAIAIAAELLLILANDKKLQKNTTNKVNSFLTSLNEVKYLKQGQPNTQLVDNKMIENWQLLYSNSLKEGTKVVQVALIKGGRLDGVKHNRVGTIISPLYDSISGEDIDAVHGVKLRKKDIGVFKLVLEFLMPGLIKNSSISMVSDDKHRPAFISLMKLYLSIIIITNNINRELRFINQKEADSGYIEITVDDNELLLLDNFNSEVSSIPDDPKSVNKKYSDLPNENNQTPAPILSNLNPIFYDRSLATTTESPVVRQSHRGVGNLAQPTHIVNNNFLTPSPMDPVVQAANLAIYTGNGVTLKTSGRLVYDQYTGRYVIG